MLATELETILVRFGQRIYLLSVLMLRTKAKILSSGLISLVQKILRQPILAL